MFAWGGLLIARKTTRVFGAYSELIGDIILTLFGLAILFNLFHL